MSIFNKIDSAITKKRWDHMRFLQILTTFLVLNILFLYLMILLLGRSGALTQEYLENSINDISRGLIVGGILGLVMGFLQLLYYYIQKEWDLHIVVPRFLFVHLITIILILIGIRFLDHNLLFTQSFGIGYTIGGLIAIIAYSGEVKIEHTANSAREEDPILLEEFDTEN